jgi:hypothetical protein
MWVQFQGRGMPECQNCGAFVTAAYARVFTPNGVEDPRVCPQCEDKIRDGSDVREARSTRRT